MSPRLRTPIRVSLHWRASIRLYMGGPAVLAIGVALLIIAFAFAIPPLWVVGLVAAWIGLALWVLGTLGHKVGRHAIWP